MKINLFIALTVLSTFALEAEQSILNEKAPYFLLHDQYNRAFTMRQCRGTVVVLLAGNREGSKQNHEWGARIAERYRNRVVIIGIADVRSAPFFMKGRIKNNFKKEKVRVLLDWKGEVFKKYGLTDNGSNIILIDKSGVVRFLCSPGTEAGACEALFKEIDQLLSS
jgi:predicted transcriptional regulator